jgi:TatD DNase family protein
MGTSRVIDTHCHLASPRFDADRAEVLRRAREVGVTDLVVPAVGPGDFAAVRALAASDPGLHAAFGIHPQLLPEVAPAEDDRLLAALEAALAAGGAVALGECGLDGPAGEAGAPMERQVRVLRAQLALARRHGLPVLLHCLRAHGPLLALLAEEPLPAGGILHSWSGSADQVLPFARLGLGFSFAGPITHAKARRGPAAARAVPSELLLVETDAPDQPPRPHHGRCEPAHLREVVGGLAAALGRPVEEVEALTAANARRILGLPAGRPA